MSPGRLRTERVCLKGICLQEENDGINEAKTTEENEEEGDERHATRDPVHFDLL